MPSFGIVISVILCLLITAVPAIDQTGTSAEAITIDFVSGEDAITNSFDVEEQNQISLQSNDCDCGPKSIGCKIENGTQVCDCKVHTRQVNGTCVEWCEEGWSCSNGGTCVNETCHCLPGMSGDMCETVEECEGLIGAILCGDPVMIQCRYNVQTEKPECHCRYFGVYDPKTRGCVECDCGKLGNCTLVDGKKTCTCEEGAAYRELSFDGDIVDKCEDCYCGDTGFTGCSFYKTDRNCSCEPGFVQSSGICRHCDCGPHGQCHFKLEPLCHCDEGYKVFLGKNNSEPTCEACDCGKNAECSFVDEEKQCKCNPGYALRDGICTACQCYAGDETVPCTFTNKIQTCLCPKGYEATKFFCNDIDECLNESNSCPPDTTDCLNTKGDYKCVCKEGYAPKSPGSDPMKDGCEDIDECEDENLCPRKHTICKNLPGNYSCTCQKGYIPVSPYTLPKHAGCEKVAKENKDDSSPWMIGTIVLGVILGICIIFIVIGMTVKRRSAKNSPDETTLKYMN